jgi:hypothetical protein
VLRSFHSIEYVTVGGTRQENDADTRVRKEDAKIIWENALKVMPALKVFQLNTATTC